MALEERYALPKEVHRLLLRDHHKAGVLRTERAKIGMRELLTPGKVPQAFWRWNRNVLRVVDGLRSNDDGIDSHSKYGQLWSLHCELMNIRPFDLYNGKLGRILMVNHALLIDVEPWIIPAVTGREAYLNVIRKHPSSNWGPSASLGDERFVR
jgi:hypothetical protein